MEASSMDRLLENIRPRLRSRQPRSPTVSDVNCLVLNSCPTPSKVAEALIAEAAAEQLEETVCIYQVEPLGRVHCQFFGARAIELVQAFVQQGIGTESESCITLPHLSIFEQFWVDA
mmetsp:Transcript_62182/g.115412  ORF Transcript_62182/g.115412 Transcript_62182/m.115412 type:complete len:117 (+) Transcript_62182:132-482(+)